MVIVAPLFIALMLQQASPTISPMYIDDVWRGEAKCETDTAGCVSETVQYSGLHLGPNAYRFSISTATTPGSWKEQEYQDGYFEPETRTWSADRLIDATPQGQGFPDWHSIGTIKLIESADGEMLSGTETDLHGAVIRKIQLNRVKK